MGNTEAKPAHEEDNEDNQKLTHEGWASLKDKKRRCCTDLLMLVSDLSLGRCLKLIILNSTYSDSIVASFDCRVDYHDGAWLDRDWLD